MAQLTGGRAGAVRAAAAGAAAAAVAVLLLWTEERLGILSSRLDRLATFRCSLWVDLNPPFSDTCQVTIEQQRRVEGLPSATLVKSRLNNKNVCSGSQFSDTCQITIERQKCAELEDLKPVVLQFVLCFSSKTTGFTHNGLYFFLLSPFGAYSTQLWDTEYKLVQLTVVNERLKVL